jgi:hypothetical protein
MTEEKTLTVIYLGTLTGKTYSTGEYSMEADEEYDVPETEAMRLHNDFGPKYFKIEGMEPEGKKADGTEEEEATEETPKKKSAKRK